MSEIVKLLTGMSQAQSGLILLQLCWLMVAPLVEKVISYNVVQRAACFNLKSVHAASMQAGFVPVLILILSLLS